eukprot:Rmarinus@m.4565
MIPRFTLDEDDDLIAEYSCHLYDGILLSGTLYVTKLHVCFYAVLFGREYKQQFRFSDVISIKKRPLALSVSESIEVSLSPQTKYYFTSFLSRQAAFKRLEWQWQKARSHPTENAKTPSTSTPTSFYESPSKVFFQPVQVVRNLTPSRESPLLRGISGLTSLGQSIGNLSDMWLGEEKDKSVGEEPDPVGRMRRRSGPAGLESVSNSDFDVRSDGSLTGQIADANTERVEGSKHSEVGASGTGKPPHTTMDESRQPESPRLNQSSQASLPRPLLARGSPARNQPTAPMSPGASGSCVATSVPSTPNTARAKSAPTTPVADTTTQLTGKASEKEKDRGRKGSPQCRAGERAAGTPG